MEKQRVLTACSEAGVRLVRFLYCDNAGLIRGKASGMQGLPGRLDDGIGLTVAMMAANLLDQFSEIEGMGPVGEVRLVPDLDTFAVLPYAPHCASISCDLQKLDGEPWEACPRDFLRRMRERAAGLGFRMNAAVEAEFILARPGSNGWETPFERTTCFSTIAMSQAAAFTDDLVSSLEAQGLVVEQYYPEASQGQHEISIRHAEALRAADNHVKLRETIRAVALNHGLHASLAPKPFPNDVGSGGHIHFSLWDDAGTNAFYDPLADDGLSKTARQFMGGVLSHLPALVALTCPSVNSYRRLQPNSWSSAYCCWGHDNREAAVRAASSFRGDRSGSTNLELKAADLSSNPYLALGGLLVAGLDGIERELDPGDPVEVNPATLGKKERKERGIKRLPETLDDALKSLERDEVLRQALGPILANAYVTVRRSEAEAFRDRGVEFEIAHHFYKY
jgi:glutamine synthetase